VTAAVATHRLTKSYGSSRGIVDLDLTVEAGEVLGFLGPNGAGKSTTIRTLLDFQRATSGAAEVLGLDIRRDSVEIRRRTGYLSGDLRLLDRLTAADHVAWCSHLRGGHDEQVTTELVERFGVVMDRPVRDLSRGNRQKVGLLLAFMHRPELLILDEPTSGLDPLVRAEFDALLRETAADGRAVLLSSHSLDEVQRVADRVTIIRDGRLVVSDSVDHLRENAVRVLELRFGEPVDPQDFAVLDGVDVVHTDGDRVDVHVAGDLKPVLARAIERDLVDLVARHADLDELFLSYYRTPGPEAVDS